MSESGEKDCRCAAAEYLNHGQSDQVILRLARVQAAYVRAIDHEPQHHVYEAGNEGGSGKGARGVQTGCLLVGGVYGDVEGWQKGGVYQAFQPEQEIAPK